MISIVTFNAGLLRRMAGLLEPTPHVEERLIGLAPALCDSGADIVALQEIYDEDHRATVRKGVQRVFPFSASDGPAPWPFLSSGLLTLARVPMISRFKAFTDGPPEERWLTRRGMLSTTIELPDGTMTLVNVHTTAGGLFSHPESSRMDAIRRRQIDALLTFAADAGGIPIIVGDLNSGPGVSGTNYRAFETAGWVDVHTWLHSDACDVTWDPVNPLNVRGPHAHCPPQRIDHLFVLGRDITSGAVTPRASKIIFKGPVVAVGTDQSLPLSDHFGVRVEVEFCGAATR